MTGSAVDLPAHRVLPALARDPLAALAHVGQRYPGAVVRLHLGPFRPYLLTAPEQVQHVLRDHADVYVREGMLWEPLRRLEGDGIASEGETWRRSRDLLQPVFSARHVASVLDGMAAAIVDAVAEYDDAAREGRPVDLVAAMTRVVHRSLIRAFFGDRIPLADAAALGTAISTAFASLGWRMALPFVPERVTLPGDRRFRRSVQAIDAIVYPHVRGSRERIGTAADIVALLASTRDADGEPLPERRVRDDVVAMFVAGTETTALALTWLWILVAGNPDVAGRLRDEVRRVVGDGVPTAAHVPELRYTSMVLHETLRLYPVGWLVPRTAARDDVLAGVPIPAGATVLVSPYLLHRQPRWWPEPDRFDPERFTADRATARANRLAYLPFGAGVHQCLGSHFFIVEAQLVVAAMLRRYRPNLVGPPQVAVRAGATLRPRRRVLLALEPVDGR
jgi:enediyne biosynthesis protein E7